MTAEARTLTDADEAVAAREGRELVRALYLALKGTQLYPDDGHPGVVRPVEALTKAIRVSLERRGPFPLTLVGDYVFIAGRRLRFDAEGYLFVAYLAEVFRQCGIGGISIVAAPTSETLSRILRILQQTAPPGASPGQAAPSGTPPGVAVLGAALKEQGIVALEFLPEQDPLAGTEISLAEGREAAARAYLKGLLVARDLFAKAQAQLPMDLLRAKRAVLSLADLILRGEPAVLALTALKDPRDYLARHAVNVCLYAVAAGRHIGYRRAGLAALGLAGFLHDLGKMRWPPDLHQKPPPLPPDDRRQIALYPAYTAVAILRQSGLSDAAILAARAALDHARHPNTGGSPTLLRRSAPTLTGQIVSVAHYLDARTSGRVYDPAGLAPEKAWVEITQETGTRFDRLAVLAVQQAVGVYPPGTLVSLTSGEIGLVLVPPPSPEAVLRPPVLLVRDSSGNPVEGPVIDLAMTGGEGSHRAILRSLNPHEVGIRLGQYLLPPNGAGAPTDPAQG